MGASPIRSADTFWCPNTCLRTPNVHVCLHWGCSHNPVFGAASLGPLATEEVHHSSSDHARRDSLLSASSIVVATRFTCGVWSCGHNQGDRAVMLEGPLSLTVAEAEWSEWTFAGFSAAAARCVEVFARSLCLLQLLAFFRLLFFAVPLTKAGHLSNRGIRSARTCLRGAPLALAIACCCCTVHASPGLSGLPVGSPSSVDFDVLDTGAPSDLRGSSDERAVSGVSSAEVTGSAVEVIFHTTPVGRQLSVQVLQLQRRSRHLSLAVSDFRGVRNLVEVVEERLETHMNDTQLFEVAPQPCSDSVVLLEFPSHCLRAGRCPVCIQIHHRDEVPAFWLEVFGDSIGLEDLRDAVGQDWPHQAQVFVADEGRPLAAAEETRIFPGCLIRVAPTTLRLPSPRTLAYKLRHFEDNLRDPWDHGFPVDFYASHTYALLQLLETTKRVQFSPMPNRSTEALESVLLSHALVSWRPYVWHWPAARVTDLIVRGQPTSLVGGAFPAGIASRAPLFVDGRNVGLHVRMYATQCGKMLLSELLDVIGLFDPQEQLLEASGTVEFDSRTRVVNVRSRPASLAFHSASGSRWGS